MAADRPARGSRARDRFAPDEDSADLRAVRAML